MAMFLPPEISIPAGIMFPYGGASVPTGYLLCDGSAISRTTYAALFDAIDVGWGPGDGVTTFNIPDMRQRFPLGKGAAGTGSTLGGYGGNIDHTHIGAAHAHDLNSHVHDLNSHSHGMALHQHEVPSWSISNASAPAGQISNISDFPPSFPPFGSSTISRTIDSTDANTTAGGTAPGFAPLTSQAAGSTDVAVGNTSAAVGNTASGGAASTSLNNAPFGTVNYIIKI